jgi:predicted nucleotidyltransferase
MAVRDELNRQREAILAIAARYGGSNLRLFGSAARGEERPDSDVDLLIDFAEDRGFGDYLAMIEAWEALIGRRVDVVIERSLSPYFRPYIEAEARPV